MSRTLSTAAIRGILAQETSEVYHILVTIDVANAPSIYMTDNAVEVVSRNKTFIPYPFAIELPSDEQGQISEARLAIDNVSRSLVDEVRNLADPLRVSIEVVTATTPDIVEYSAYDYVLRDISYDALTISGTLTQDDFLAEPYPKDVMSAANFPGLF